MINKKISFGLGFIALFLLYHAAEYMIMFQNSALGFLGFQALFFVCAFLIGKLQFREGLSAWGLGFNKKFYQSLFWGIIMGITLYGSTFLIGLLSDSEKISSIPTLKEALFPVGLFIFGNFFSSFSEDILTRGYIQKHLKFLHPMLILLLSASIYLLNHIYRLTDGIETYMYLFSLGIIFCIPLLTTGKLWFTGGMHWAGNVTFYITHEIIKTESGSNSISPNIILTIMIFVLFPVIYFMTQKFNSKKDIATLNLFNNPK